MLTEACHRENQRPRAISKYWICTHDTPANQRGDTAPNQKGRSKQTKSVFILWKYKLVIHSIMPSTPLLTVAVTGRKQFSGLADNDVKLKQHA